MSPTELDAKVVACLTWIAGFISGEVRGTSLYYHCQAHAMRGELPCAVMQPNRLPDPLSRSR